MVVGPFGPTTALVILGEVEWFISVIAFRTIHTGLPP
jgi:hypothetical protein